MRERSERSRSGARLTELDLLGLRAPPAGSADQSGPDSVRGHTSLGLDALSNLLSWLNRCGRNFSDCALLSAMQRSLLSLPSSNNVRTCLACFLFPCIKYRLLPDTHRSSACSTNKTLEGE